MVVNPNSIETDPTIGLPLWPFRNRRKLEAQWLEDLESKGISEFANSPIKDGPSELQTAIEQFNAGEFWECHETLEDVWRETPYPFRLFYHAIIKSSVGFHHLSGHNRKGALAKLRDGVRLLKIFQPEWLGVRTNRLLADTSEWLSRIESTDLDWSELDSVPRPRIATIEAQDGSA